MDGLEAVDLMSVLQVLLEIKWYSFSKVAGVCYLEGSNIIPDLSIRLDELINVIQ